MPDVEGVMQALKDSLRNLHCGFIENVGNMYAVSEETINNALELLKEQESIAPSVLVSNGPGEVCSWWYLCSKCKKPIDKKDRFCKRCGQAVKWE